MFFKNFIWSISIFIAYLGVIFISLCLGDENLSPIQLILILFQKMKFYAKL